MSAISTLPRAHTSSLLKPILIGGAIAGAFDEIAAFVSMGWKVPRVVAAGLVGTWAIKSTSDWVWVLGVVLHFVVAFGAATVYCFASRRLPFLKDHFIVCGMFFGIAVFLVMYLVVMPLCAFHYIGPYTLRGLLQGIVIHMVLIGLPIGFSLRWWG
ncbi:MAG TPA: hypothetical protein VGJ21_18005 [Terracidiphilus sp.]|jgi:hypothetical protein